MRNLVAMRRPEAVVGVLLFVATAFAATISAPRLAHADSAAAEVESKTKEAMDSYDLLEYEEAKKGLSNALLLAKKRGLSRDPVTANVHIYLAIVYFSGFQDTAAAKLELANAIEIDPSVTIPKAYRSEEIEAVFEELRSQLSGATAGDGVDAGIDTDTDAAGGVEDCAVIEGVQHQIVETAPAGSAAPIEVQVGSDLDAAKVGLFYRAAGEVEFKEVTMGRTGTCTFRGSIPASAVTGNVLHYYVAVFDKRGKIIGSRGSDGSPNIMEITAAVAATDGDDPLSSPEPDVGTSASTSSGKRKRLFLSVEVGSGGGYVTGTTEKENVPVQCCLAPALFHLMPELGYWVSPNTSVSAAVRIGFPVGASVPGHASTAPAGFLRIRHSFGAEPGTGFSLTGSVGGGIIRHTVKISNAAPGQDTDTTATGPLFVGAGLGYIKDLTGTLRLVAELHSLLGLPVVDQLGCPGNGCVMPHFGAQVDANLGLLVAF